MERGDLSNTPAPKMIIVFEGLLGEIPPENAKAFAKAMNKRRWRQAAGLFVVDDLMVRKMWRLYFTLNVTFEVVTFLGSEFAADLELVLDTEELPVSRVWHCQSPQMLARRVAYMPGLVRVYDGDPANIFAYGSAGTVIDGADGLGRDLRSPLVK